MTNSTPNLPQRQLNWVIGLFETLIYGGRWIVAPMYVGLLVALVIYTYRYMAELIELCLHARVIEESSLMLTVLGLVDTTMIGNLLLLIMVGSYSIFIRKIGGEHDRPQWLEGISSSTLKIKMGASLIGISSVHLLRDFVGAETVGRELIGKHVIIHCVFIVSTLALAFSDKITHSTSNSTHQ